MLYMSDSINQIYDTFDTGAIKTPFFRMDFELLVLDTSKEEKM